MLVSPLIQKGFLGLVEGVRQPRIVNKKVRLMCHAVKVYFCHLARTQVREAASNTGGGVSRRSFL